MRTLSLLRKEYRVSLQHLREVAAKLDHMKDTLWTATTLYVVKRRVALVRDRDKPPIDPLTGQYAIEGIALKAVNDVEREPASLFERQQDQVGKVTGNRYVAHNAAVITGTRIPTRAIKSFHDEGYSIDAIIREYPDLKPADVRATLAHEQGRVRAS